MAGIVNISLTPVSRIGIDPSLIKTNFNVSYLKWLTQIPVRSAWLSELVTVNYFLQSSYFFFSQLHFEIFQSAEASY